MTCPKCGSNNVNTQIVSETYQTEKKHGFLWWLCIGLWWVPVKWLFFTLPALIIKIFAPRRYKTTTVHKSMCICQNCGHHWTA